MSLKFVNNIIPIGNNCRAKHSVDSQVYINPFQTRRYFEKN